MEKTPIQHRPFQRSGKLVIGKFYAYLLPTIMMNVALSLGIIIDGIIVGNFLGTEAFSAVNICAPIMFGFSAIYALFGVGGSTVMAHAKGRMDNDTANTVFTLSILGLIVISLILGGIGFIFSDNIAMLLSGGSKLYPLVKDYFTILIIGAPFLIVVPGTVYFIRTDSRPKLSANILILANVFNLIFDLIFINVFKMGIAGAALASVLGYVLGAGISLMYFMSKDRTLKFIKPLKKDLAQYGNILTTGLPTALYGATGFIKNLSINTIILSTVGADGVAMFAVCLNILAMSSIAIGGTAQTLVPVVGCTYGEKDYQGIRAIMKTALATVIALCLFLLIIFELFPIQVAGIFGISASQILTPLETAIRLFALSLPFFGINFLMMCYYQTIKRKVISSTITILDNLVFILPLIFIFQFLLGNEGIWLAFLVAELLTLGTTLVIVLWVRRKSAADLSPFLLLETLDAQILDLTIENNMFDASSVSEAFMAFGKEHNMDEKQRNRVGVIAEELTANIIRYGSSKQKRSYIDIRLIIIDSEIILRIRDDGIPFNPVKYIKSHPLKDTYGLSLVSKMAKDFEYTYVLNFNNIMVRI
ncbi:MAG: ATP-binding protein [Acetobacterium sp.]|nr:ATP-binding protein [Acetobacterium sp.]